MWIYANPNPSKKQVPDCVIRAICIALNKSWLEVSDELYGIARREYSVTCDDNVWGRYLYSLGFEPFLLPFSCPVSREQSSYEDGYSQGYAMAMNQNGGGNSGHYPMNPYYPERPRW